MATMRVVQVSRPNGPFEIVERPLPEPGAGSVRVKVEACGICHSDSVTKEGLLPGIQYPRVPGHEVAGVIDAVGPGVPGWEPGPRVSVGWNGGYCGYCDYCRRGEFFACVRGQTTGVTFDGGYGGYMIAPIVFSRAPDGLTSCLPSTTLKRSVRACSPGSSSVQGCNPKTCSVGAPTITTSLGHGADAVNRAAHAWAFGRKKSSDEESGRCLCESYCSPHPQRRILTV